MRKAQGMPLQVIVIAILVLVVLIVLLGIFIFKITKFSSESDTCAVAGGIVLGRTDCTLSQQRISLGSNYKDVKEKNSGITDEPFVCCRVGANEGE